MTNHPLPQSYLFSNVGVFDSNNGVDFVTGVDDLGIIQTAYANSFGTVVVVSPNSVFIGNTTWQINITAPSPPQIAGGYVLLANGGWGPGGAGGGTPGGPNNSIQFSNGGVLAGNGLFTWANGVMTVGSGTLNSTSWSGSAETANSASFIGTLPAANVVSNTQLQSNLANYVLTATLGGYVTTTALPTLIGQNTANNTTFVGTVSAANVVSNSQLQANLSNYTNTAGLPAVIAVNTANNANYLGGILANQYAYANQAGGIWTVKSANYTAVLGDRILADTTAGAFTVTLPSTPANGATVAFADQANTWVTNNLTINPNGANVAGSSANLVCDVSAYFQLLYEKNGWQVSVTNPPAASPSGAIIYNTTQSLSNTATAQARSNIGLTGSTGRVRMAANVSFTASTTTKVAFDTVDFDTTAMWDSTNKWFKPKQSGTYLVSCSVSVAGTLTTGTSFVQVFIGKNGSVSTASNSQGEGYAYSSSTTIVQETITALVQVNGTTDTIECDVSCNGTSPVIQGLPVPNIRTFMIITRVGD